MQKLAEICVRRPVFATVIILALTVIGGFSFFTLGVDRFPKIDIPTVSVNTTNTGAAPAEMESEVTDVLEGAVNTATGIDELRSSSSTGRSSITISFDLSKDPDVATQEVRDKVNTVLNRLPQTADPPIIQKSDPDATPILLYSMTGPYSVLQLTDIAQNQISKRIQSAYGVGDVVIYAVKQRMAEVIPTLPHDLKFAIVRDQSEFIENSLHAIEEHLIIGGLLAALVVFIFLWNFRSTIISAIAIPTSIIAAFAFLAAFGYSLNQMTMLALTPMVGIVIDDAIVVLENIYRFVEEKGLHPFQAAIEGTREIGLAVLATTLSLLAVFLPVGFMGGIVGRFMSSFGLTSAAAIAVSLIVSFTLTPMLAARWIKAPKHEGTREEFEGYSGFPDVNEEPEKEHTPSAESDSKAGVFYGVIENTY